MNSKFRTTNSNVLRVMCQRLPSCQKTVYQNASKLLNSFTLEVLSQLNSSCFKGVRYPQYDNFLQSLFYIQAFILHFQMFFFSIKDDCSTLPFQNFSRWPIFRCSINPSVIPNGTQQRNDRHILSLTPRQIKFKMWMITQEMHQSAVIFKYNLLNLILIE